MPPSEQLTAYLRLVEQAEAQTYLLRDIRHTLALQLAILGAEAAQLSQAEITAAIQVGESRGLPLAERPEKQSEVEDSAYWRAYAEAVWSEVEAYWADRSD